MKGLISAFIHGGEVKKSFLSILGPFRMALFPELWNAGHHNLGNLS